LSVTPLAKRLQACGRARRARPVLSRVVGRQFSRLRAAPELKHSGRMAERRDLQRALANGDLHLNYQPIVDPRTGNVVSVEALLRGRDDDQRDWNVAAITAEAEKSSDIFDLDRWIIEQACMEAAQWQRGLLADVFLNLNFSTREFQNPQFVHHLTRETGSAGIDVRKINLEITETAMIHDPSNAESVVNELQEHGFHLWLDDFGTGHSSLLWLKWFEVQGLKIPSQFVTDLVSNDRCRAIVDGVVLIARTLGIDMVAEGIENREQLNLLLEKGVNFFQGFYFFKPMPAEELQSRMTEVRSLP
jgi:EAL domain-containing protein (putative c-di-GMP-specific phosphodiesterase class I)